ncbi:uncharacterized protein LOC126995142 [Eriocheir sinensis]|uniref:uncharacterized protein LOC126995142 n=1 Tax=Eriocheir sinensis TaxID=95602 RepID=UPI0021C7286E|nr:uncharacterized protein LOC126995142 [Eriocheir sinensis]
MDENTQDDYYPDTAAATAITFSPEINTDDDIVPVYSPQHRSQLYLSNNPPTVSHDRVQDYDPYYPTGHSIPSQHPNVTGARDTGRYRPQTPVTMAESSSPHLLQPPYFQGHPRLGMEQRAGGVRLPSPNNRQPPEGGRRSGRRSLRARAAQRQRGQQQGRGEEAPFPRHQRDTDRLTADRLTDSYFTYKSDWQK